MTVEDLERLARGTVVFMAMAAHGIAPAPASAQADARADTLGTLEVSASASVTVPADRARIGFAVETEASSAAAAAADNAGRMDAVMRAVRDAAGDDATVATSGYSVRPRYVRQSRAEAMEQRIEGYTAVNEVQVTLVDLERVGAVIDAAMSAGANRVAGVGFYASDTEGGRLRALREAVAKARAEAEAIAEAMEARLGPVVSVRTEAQRPVQPFRAEVAMAQAVATPVEPGDQTVTATVTIIYRLGGG